MVTETLAPRSRKVKILATLGPASSDARTIRKLMLAGADAFRINMSHGDRKTKAKLVEHIRALEKEFHRPTTILFDLQGPKLRVGHFAGGKTMLEKGSRFILDRKDKAGDSKRVQLPHPELFESIRAGTRYLPERHFHWPLRTSILRPRSTAVESPTDRARQTFLPRRSGTPHSRLRPVVR